MAGVRAADPADAVRRSLAEQPLPATNSPVTVIAIGKAALGMAEAALATLPNIGRCLVVTNYENERALPGATVMAAGHPVPDEAGLRAGQAVIDVLSDLGEDDVVLALISGGGSALLPAPVEGVSLADKARVSEVLLAGGIDITGMNLVRQQLSRLKGGGFARYAAPAEVVSLILSDVVGDDLSVIASGPTVPPIGTPTEARALLENNDLWARMPQSVRQALTDRPETPAAMPTAENRLISSNAISVAAMAALDPTAHVAKEPLDGDVAAAAQRVVARQGAGIWLFGGETTVHLRGSGLGGRNQELALRVALLAEDLGWGDNWVFLSGGTDGRDGPTDAAGGLVDGGTLARMRQGGIDPKEFLDNNDSYNALKAAGDLLITGATGTNVADLQVLIRR